MNTLAENPGSSTRPYLVRALHEWCTDNGFTPYIAVYVDSTVQVPMEHVKNNEIVLNVGFEATSGLKLGNEVLEFRARFSGVSRDIRVPLDHVVAIYARENGQGMAFPVPTPQGAGKGAEGAATKTAVSKANPVAAETTRGPRLTAVDSGSTAASEGVSGPTDGDSPEPPSPEPTPSGGRPSLKRIK